MSKRIYIILQTVPDNTVTQVHSAYMSKFMALKALEVYSTGKDSLKIVETNLSSRENGEFK
tara:strand:+ start:6418 stop:6600 length:183 start_codon:yes stop_codon:yes gene_type:complete